MSYSIQDFIQLIARLRDPNGGCPWDLKQNYESMIPCLIEETYEVVEAIQKKDIPNLREELGDLLLQVVFFSQLASEDQHFTFNDVLNDVAEKIVRRHPHVFADATAGNEEEALARWNSIKALEKSKTQNQSILDEIPSAFPALMRAQKLQKQCSKIGFDWTEISPVFEKIEEELQEVKEEVNKNPQNKESIEEEIGDLFFATVNLSRHLKCNAEESLRKANHKFEQRFRKVEQKAKEMGKELTALSLIEMDVLWDEVKKEEKIAS
ncbi:nucleoside triphosphate pyrophosphohydrolase [Rodentibacter trehalosifermentans]|uniref:Nucleoside triphosphate pyrophosphohydrolase n=1 Tax=Rodentibacter trehalosifermentans TaxID=1908263 RepID=A0A1V3IQ38_9PAST|nr:nucleoside triphosphate pyrophosphohydrolase [Rodentibacter trehalosifermentans]OOF44303.1 nucleoside triphosphate pyrophosphohydrolase [Rodentibacter trehalosifermentans]OOF47394.1 nucleoside triphosphate pyrophosphohydrolase [Rodentibacter trehalosifermentans]OOF52214.1 nucleoside triphosphate pyrophosphohydrolase [Rodentibacter trehalosifermentans]